MLTHTHVLTLNRSIPLNGNRSSIASLSPTERWASIRMQRIHHLRVCANTYTCNRTNHQWEHIMHHQSIPIGEVGIYKNAIHIGVCANTYLCTDTHVYTCAALLHLRQKKAAQISPSTENRWEASRVYRGRGTNFFISTVQS